MLSPTTLFMFLLYGYALLTFLRYSFYHYEAGRLTAAWELDAWLDYLSDPFYWNILATTLRLAVVVTVLCVVIGYPIAYFLHRLRSDNLKQWFAILIFAPLLVSVVVRAYGWLILLSSSGLVNYLLTSLGLIEEPLRLVFNFTGVVIATVHVLLPFAAFPILSVMVQLEPALKEAASDLGASRWQTFRHVVFPLTIPGVAAAAQIIFPLVLSAFVTPSLLGGGRVTVLSQIIYRSTIDLNWPIGAVAGFVLITLTMIGLLLFERLTRRLFGNWQLAE